MANAFGSLYVGQSGLQSAQYALNATANNLSNVDTKGYVREQVRFQDRNYLQIRDTRISINGQQSGLGVSIADVVHARDMFLDKAYRTESGRQAFYETCADATDQVIDLFQELYGEEFKNSMNEFSVAFQELAKDPSDTTYQSLLIQKADLFNARCQSLYSDLQNYQSNINDEIKDDVKRINEIGQEIYKLNLDIQKIENGGVETAMELRDRRDNLLDELGSYGAIEITEDMTGFVYVDFERQRFVDDNRAYEIGLKEDSGTGFVTPYWKHLSNLNAKDTKGNQQIVQVFHTEVPIDPDYQNDMGKTKARLLARGAEYGRYYDIDQTVHDTDEYKLRLNNRVVMETQAEIDKLYNTMVTQINDLLSPRMTCDNSDNNKKIVTVINQEETPSREVKLQAQGITDGKLTLAEINDDGSLGASYEVDLTDIIGDSNSVQVLDVANSSFGVDGKLPPHELFTRFGNDRFIPKEVTVGGKNFTLYVYDEGDLQKSSTLYTIGNVQVNPLLVKDYTQLPTYIDNPNEAMQQGAQSPAVNMKMAQELVALWGTTNEQLYITPNDSYPCKYAEFYDKVISKLTTEGNVYTSKSVTTADAAASTNVKRQQVTGVSSDEELTKMIKFQAAYNASSRYITVISQMTELLVTGLI